MIFNIQKRTYYLGEPLVKSGEVPDGMFIITSGQCKAVLQSIGVKQIESGEFSRFQKKPKNFACGVVPDQPFSKIKSSSTEPSSLKEKDDKHEHLKQKEESLMTKFNADNSAFNYLKGDQKRTFQSSRIYLDDENKHLGQHIAYKDNVILSRFTNIFTIDNFQ